MSYDLMVSSHITPLGFGTALGYFARKGIDKMFIIASGAYANIGDWIEQLVAESSGKQGKGILPVIDNEIQLPESFRSDRMYVFIRTQGDSEYDTVISELTESGYPVFVFELRDSYDISAHMYLWEYATAVFCQMLGVNPFDQPDVEAAKKLAREVIETFRKTGRLSDDPPECSDGGLSVFSSMGIESTDKIIPALFADLSSRDYAAILVYADGSDDRVHQVLLELRRCIERRYGIPVTVGFGPRYLHSTGQLHKGDAGLGRFLILTGISDTDIPIPEAAETSRQQVSFGILKRAQSIGDYRALRKAGRKVVRLDAPESSFTQALRMLKMFLL